MFCKNIVLLLFVNIFKYLKQYFLSLFCQHDLWKCVSLMLSVLFIAPHLVKMNNVKDKVYTLELLGQLGM